VACLTGVDRNLSTVVASGASNPKHYSSPFAAGQGHAGLRRCKVTICGAEFHLWGVAHMTTDNALPGRSPAQGASIGDQPTGRSAGTGSGAQAGSVSGAQAGSGSGGWAGTGSGGWANTLHGGALIFGGVSTILVALRLLSAANANPETAYGILQAGGTSDVIIGTVLSLIPSIALIGASYLALGRIWAKFPDSKFPDSGKLTQAEELGIWTSICALFLVAVLTMPFRYAAAPAAVVLALILARIFRDWIEKKRKEKWGRRGVKVAAGLIAAAFLLGVIVSPPWMPAEQLTFTKASKDKPVVGYVLDQSQTGLTVLSLDPRQVLYFGPKDLTKEVACSAFQSDDLPIVYHTGLIRIFHLFTYPHC
jgi:hypothetical protein